MISSSDMKFILITRFRALGLAGKMVRIAISMKINLKESCNSADEIEASYGVDDLILQSLKVEYS